MEIYLLMRFLLKILLAIASCLKQDEIQDVSRGRSLVVMMVMVVVMVVVVVVMVVVVMVVVMM